MRDDVVGFLISPHLIDLILFFAVLEAVGLILLRRRLGPRRPSAAAATAASSSTALSQSSSSGQYPSHTADGTARPPPVGTAEIILLVLPGLCLMLAIRAALAGAAWPWVPAALAAALVAHLADIRKRWLS